MRHPTPEQIDHVVRTFEIAIQNRPRRRLDMSVTTIQETHACGTVACHAGWYALGRALDTGANIELRAPLDVERAIPLHGRIYAHAASISSPSTSRKAPKHSPATWDSKTRMTSPTGQTTTPTSGKLLRVRDVLPRGRVPRADEVPQMPENQALVDALDEAPGAIIRRITIDDVIQHWRDVRDRLAARERGRS